MNDQSSSSISRLVDGATFVPRATPNQWFAVQIDLPEQSSGLHELFSLQLLVRRGEDKDEEHQPANLSDTSNSDSLRLRLDGNSLRIRFVPCCLSAWVILGERYEVDHYADSLELEVNCQLRLQTRSQPLTGDEPWLVRGTLVSGSIRLTNPDAALLHRSLLSNRLWPNGEQIEGIYLSGGQFQIQVLKRGEKPEDDVRRRMQFVTATRNTSNQIDQAIWRQVAVTQPGADPVQLPQNRLEEILKNVTNIAQSDENGVTVESAPAEPAILSIVTMPTPGNEGAVREFLRPGRRLTFTSDGSTTQWTPGTLFVLNEAGETSYVLTDHDEVEYFRQNGRTSDEPSNPDAQLQWQVAPTVEQLRDTFLTSTSPAFPAERTQLWQLLKLSPEDAAPDSSFKNRPPSWVRYEIDPPELLPKDQSTPFARIESLSAPFQLKPVTGTDWKLQLDLARDVDDLVPRMSPVRLRCTLQAGKPLKLEFFAADVTVESPEMRLYHPALPDPLSVPNERNLDAQHSATGTDPLRQLYDDYRLVFRAVPITPNAERPTGETEPDLPPFGLMAYWRYEQGALTNGQFRLTCNGSTVTAYLPANRALVDPVSVTRGNLMGKTVIRAAILDLRSQVLSVEQVEFSTVKESEEPESERVPVTNITVDQLLGISVNERGLFCEWLPRPSAKFTVEVGGNPTHLKSENHPLRNGDRVRLQTTGALPGPLSLEVDYFVIRSDSQFVELTSSRDGPPIALNSDGTGTLTVLNRIDDDRPVIVAEIYDILESNRIILRRENEITRGDYSLLIGPPRLAIPRDPNHGLIPLELHQFQWNFPRGASANPLPELYYDVKSLRGNEVSSVMALLPWVEWGPAVPEWLRTGRVRLHHRNLVQEHSEFESSFEDRFPPGGPQPDPTTGQQPSPLLPFADFVQSVRDRYTEASGNLTTGLDEATGLGNWLPGATWLPKNSDVELVSKLVYEEYDEKSKTGVFPQIKLTWQSEDPPSGAIMPSPQTLRVRRATDEEASDNWLEFDVETDKLNVGSKPVLRIADASSAPPEDQRRVVNSAAPLLFDRRTPLTLVYAPKLNRGNLATVVPGSPIEVVTTAQHGLTTGESIRIVGVTGTTGANGIHRVTVLSSTRIALDNTDDDATLVGPGTWEALSYVVLASYSGANAALWISSRERGRRAALDRPTAAVRSGYSCRFSG